MAFLALCSTLKPNNVVTLFKLWCPSLCLPLWNYNRYLKCQRKAINPDTDLPFFYWCCQITTAYTKAFIMFLYILYTLSTTSCIHLTWTQCTVKIAIIKWFAIKQDVVTQPRHSSQVAQTQYKQKSTPRIKPPRTQKELTASRIAFWLNKDNVFHWPTIPAPYSSRLHLSDWFYSDTPTLCICQEPPEQSRDEWGQVKDPDVDVWRAAAWNKRRFHNKAGG